MNTELEFIDDYNTLQNWLDAYCEQKNRSGWHKFGPADLSDYQQKPSKVLLVNSESMGYGGCKKTPADEYLKWIAGRWATPRYGAVLVSLVKEYIEILTAGRDIPPYDKARVAAVYRNEALLLERMRGTIYMNARVSSNDTGSPKEETVAIVSDAQEFSAFRRRYVEIMKPEIIICAGVRARDSFFADGGAFAQADLPRSTVSKLNGHIIVITPHLSRPGLFGGYKALHNISSDCAKLFVGSESIK